MRKIIYFISATLLLQACGTGSGKNTSNSDTSARYVATVAMGGPLRFQNVEGESGLNSAAVKVGEIVSFIPGKFSLAGKNDTAYVIKTKQGVGNASEDGTPDVYVVKFTGSGDVINIGCCDARLINEGDLNGDGKEELSVFQYPENGNTCTFKTYTFSGGSWKELFDPFLVPAAGEPVTNRELQGKVVSDSGAIYYYDLVDSNESFIPVKTKAVLK